MVVPSISCLKPAAGPLVSPTPALQSLSTESICARSPRHPCKTREDRCRDEQSTRRDTSDGQAPHGRQGRTQHRTKAHVSVEFRVECRLYHCKYIMSLLLFRTDEAWTRSCTDARDNNAIRSWQIGATSRSAWMPFGRAKQMRDVRPPLPLVPHRTTDILTMAFQ